jgi:hypothetical protein
MKLTSLAFVLTLICQDTVPFKPKEEFDVKIDLQLKQRPQDSDANTVDLSDQPKRKPSSAMLPYLYLRVSFLKLSPEEVRLTVKNNFDKKVVNRKIEKNPILVIDAGFTDDLKDRGKTSEFVITMLSADKTDLSKIVIQIEEDGTFLINGDKRGKF